MMIRPATAADVPAIVAMAREFIASSLYRHFIPFDPDAVEVLVGKAREVGVILLAVHDGAPVGMIAFFPVIEPFSGQVMTDELAWWVAPAHRRGLTGPRLLLAYEAWARAHDIHMCKMIAPIDQPAVARYYERLGYVPVETTYIRRLD